MVSRCPLFEGTSAKTTNEDNDSDMDSLSPLDGQSVVSGCEGGSIILGNQVVTFHFQQADGVDRASLDRAKDVVCGGESWAEKTTRMLRTAKESANNKEDSFHLRDCQVE
mmetsp:Transcript_13697/g.24055  ORF Transcript_13697/g.24055 Transcript_13697/m.24055 type:complete len:110 (-) Transcript_13697:919-1248(-)